MSQREVHRYRKVQEIKSKIFWGDFNISHNGPTWGSPNLHLVMYGLLTHRDPSSLLFLAILTETSPELMSLIPNNNHWNETRCMFTLCDLNAAFPELNIKMNFNPWERVFNIEVKMSYMNITLRKIGMIEVKM